jgi:hypothetical protein
MSNLMNNPNNPPYAQAVGPQASQIKPPQSGIYGQPAPYNLDQNLGIVNHLKDREMADFKDKANFMADLSLKQDRLRALYDPQKMSAQAPQQDPYAGSNASIQNQKNMQSLMNPKDPNAIGASQKADLDMKQKQLDQQGKLGQEAQDTKAAQEKLNQQKSDQIHAQKIAELESKQTESKNKLDLATQGLADKTKSAADQLALHKTIMDNTKAYHDAEMAKQDLKFQKSQSDHKDQMDMMQKKLDAANKSVKTTLSQDGTSKTVQTTTGSPPATVRVQGKDGIFGTISADKLDDWNANHAHPDSPPPALAGPQASPDSDDEDDSSENGR